MACHQIILHQPGKLKFFHLKKKKKKKLGSPFEYFLFVVLCKKRKLFHVLQKTKTKLMLVCDSVLPQDQEPVPPLPTGRVLLDRRVRKDVDTVFQMMHTNSQFYRNWLVRFIHRRRMEIEEKGKIIAAAWGTELVQFLAAL